ncbi:MAG TPA: hypothetical protein VGK73_17940 [Polyangiaceae bacterium]
MVERGLRFLRLLLLGPALWLSGCESGATVKELGSETHFLASCVDGCEDGLTCLCGVCTKVCGADATCGALAEGASCVGSQPRIADGTCEDEGAGAFCDYRCSTDADCGGFPFEAHCDAGYCRSGSAPLCERSDTTGTGVVVLGDALIELTPFTSHLEGLAREDGSLAEGRNFRAYATALNSFLAGDTLSLAVQYDLARDDGPFRVAVMNGGETDMMQGTCGNAPQSDCAAIQAAASGLSALFTRMAEDGVTEVVYFFYADPVDRPMVKAGLDVLRPLVQETCASAPLTCHFIDLRPVFENHYPEYVGSDGLVFSEAGARASADTVWQTMQAECVAW